MVTVPVVLHPAMIKEGCAHGVQVRTNAASIPTALAQEKNILLIIAPPRAEAVLAPEVVEEVAHQQVEHMLYAEIIMLCHRNVSAFPMLVQSLVIHLFRQYFHIAAKLIVMQDCHIQRDASGSLQPARSLHTNQAFT
jgi:hypothetical protein